MAVNAKNAADFIEILNVKTQNKKRMLKTAFLGMPVGKDGTRSGWIEASKAGMVDVNKMIPPELQSTQNAGAIRELAADVADKARAEAEEKYAKEKEDLNKTISDQADAITKQNTELDSLRRYKEEHEKDKSSADVERLADFIIKNFPDDIHEGGAVDNAIVLIQKLAGPSGQKKGGK